MKSLRRLLTGRLRPSWYCCGVDYPRLVEGRADFLVYKKSFPWDHAPGSLIVTESGGRVGYPDGTDYDPRSLRPGIVAASDEATFDSVSRLVHDTLASVP
jgi:fructose-1,6-bisphosphatase/inositol monophosphatase family enzyme